jgi:hypothetical protein
MTPKKTSDVERLAALMAPPVEEPGIQDQPLSPSHRGMGPSRAWNHGPKSPRTVVVTPKPPKPAKPVRKAPMKPLDYREGVVEIDSRRIPHLRPINPVD